MRYEALLERLEVMLWGVLTIGTFGAALWGVWTNQDLLIVFAVFTPMFLGGWRNAMRVRRKHTA